MHKGDSKRFLAARDIKPSNIRLEFIEQKSTGAKRPVSVLFVHGLYHGAWAFKDGLMPFFAANGYETYALSLRGHGASEGKDILKSASFDDYLADLRQALAKIPGEVILIGHSLGGMLVQKHLESETAAGAILMCSPTRDDMKAAQLATLKMFPWPVLKLVITGNPDHFYHDRKACRATLFAGDASEETTRAIDNLLKEHESQRVFKDLLNFEAGRPSAATPVMVIGGGADSSVPKSSLENQAKFYGGELKIYPGKPHEVFVPPGWENMANDMLGWVGRRVRVAA